jgi:hypothetical protein
MDSMSSDARKVARVSGLLGADLVRQDTTLPEPYNFTFFTLPGDEALPIYLLSPLTGDGIDETMFWVPAAKTLIAGDTVYGDDYHLFLADLATPALTKSWQSTLELIADLKPSVIVPGHTTKDGAIDGMSALDHTRRYLELWQAEIESRGIDHYTPTEIAEILGQAFPNANSQGSMTILNISAENYGRGGVRQEHSVPLETFVDIQALNGWDLS